MLTTGGGASQRRSRPRSSVPFPSLAQRHWQQVWNAGHTAQAQISQSQPLLGQQSMLSQPCVERLLPSCPRLARHSLCFSPPFSPNNSVGQVANQMSNMSMSGGGGGDDSGAAFSVRCHDPEAHGHAALPPEPLSHPPPARFSTVLAPFRQYGAPLLPSSSAPKVMTEGAEPYAVSPIVGGSGGGATGSLRPGASMGMGGAASMGAGTSATLPTNREKVRLA